MNTYYPRPRIWSLFGIWALIGLQSFGGGASTIYLIYQTFVDKRGWLAAEEYNQFWNLSVMAPGINLLGLTILIGRKLGGVRGIVVSLAGLLLPSATITCLLTAGFLGVERFPAVQAMIRGVVPATAGIMLVVGWKYAQPILKQARAEGLPRLLFSLAIIVAGALAIILFQVTIPLILLCSALLSIILFTRPVTPQLAKEVARQAQAMEAEETHD